jgi:hypothetical protein
MTSSGGPSWRRLSVSTKEGCLTGEEAVHRRPRHPSLGGQLVHRQGGQSVLPDQVQGGLEHSIAGRRVGVDGQLPDKLVPAAEVPVEGGLGDPGGPGHFFHRRASALGESGADGDQDAAARIDATTLDEPSRLVNSYFV